jgi:hypothetical protein
MRHGKTPVRLGQGLTHTSWLNGLREGIFGYGVEVLRLEDLVHGSGGHVMGAVERFRCCRKDRVRRVRGGWRQTRSGSRR